MMWISMLHHDGVMWSGRGPCPAQTFPVARSPPRQETPVTHNHPPTYASVKDSSLCSMGAPSDAPHFEARHWLKHPASSLTGTLEGNLQTAKAESGYRYKNICSPQPLALSASTTCHSLPSITCAQGHKNQVRTLCSCSSSRRSHFLNWTSSRGGFLEYVTHTPEVSGSLLRLPRAATVTEKVCRIA